MKEWKKTKLHNVANQKDPLFCKYMRETMNKVRYQERQQEIKAQQTNYVKKLVINAGHMHCFQAINSARNLPNPRIKKLLYYKEQQMLKDRNLRIKLGMETKQEMLQRKNEKMENILKIGQVHKEKQNIFDKGMRRRQKEAASRGARTQRLSPVN